LFLLYWCFIILIIFRCFRPKGIRAKWAARNKEELPNWGPNKKKLNLDYLTVALRNANIFGEEKRRLYQVTPLVKGDLNFAPGYVWKNKDRFGFLLYPDIPA